MRRRKKKHLKAHKYSSNTIAQRPNKLKITIELRSKVREIAREISSAAWLVQSGQGGRNHRRNSQRKQDQWFTINHQIYFKTNGKNTANSLWRVATAVLSASPSCPCHNAQHHLSPKNWNGSPSPPFHPIPILVMTMDRLRLSCTNR